MEHWDELLRLAASIMTRALAPSTILKWCSSSKSSELAKASRELDRIERTMFMIEWYSSPALRRRCQAGLNKGEAAHKLKRAVFFHERGEIRDRSFDSQAFRASGLNLMVSAIVHWNTVISAGRRPTCVSRAAIFLTSCSNTSRRLVESILTSPASIRGTPSSKDQTALESCGFPDGSSGLHDVHTPFELSDDFLPILSRPLSVL